MIDLLYSVPAFVVVLGVLIFVHELGHFLAAKAVGVGVPRFSIGLGPVSPLRWRRGETEYVLSWVPFGGYVKMASREEQEQLAALEGGGVEEEWPPEKLFESKSLAARILVISAGVIFNALFAWVVFTAVAFAWGRPDFSVRLETVEEGPAAVAGLRSGDEVRAVGGDPITTAAGLITAIRQHAGRPLSFEVLRDGERLTFEVVPEAAPEEDGEPYGRIGVRLAQVRAGYVELSPADAFREGVWRTVSSSAQILVVVREMIFGRISARELGGPIFISQTAGQLARQGLEELLTFMAFLSVNLAVLNLLPIPVLDGGHLVFLFLEGLRRGRPVPLAWRTRLTMIGLYFLLALMVFVTINDILR